MTAPYIATATAAALLLLQQLLMLNVGTHRARSGVFIGNGADRALERKQRRHGNLAENAAMFVVTLGFAEIIGVAPVLVGSLGGIFVVGRALHAFGFSSETGSHGGEGSKLFVAGRVLGSFSTALTGLFLGSYLIYTLAIAAPWG